MQRGEICNNVSDKCTPRAAYSSPLVWGQRLQHVELTVPSEITKYVTLRQIISPHSDRTHTDTHTGNMIDTLVNGLLDSFACPFDGEWVFTHRGLLRSLSVSYPSIKNSRCGLRISIAVQESEPVRLW